ncbi:hypothetical protein DDZ18_11900 [Marinicauda salina]|jgi:hypothetical protein|uniref:Uncharacterized protein n=1 Tax=Marinicauda salina TaxID=2135793 RepID=A0A2U2BR37_9PROT|nr:hypothetical protein [Marinicauda salina]PWE16472.1 hypothetical protein DDZ18_11900 [Marinicauda salina]
MTDALDHLGEPPHEPGEAADYLTDALKSMAQLALAADLPNSSAMLEAAAKLVDQEGRLGPWSETRAGGDADQSPDG